MSSKLELYHPDIPSRIARWWLLHSRINKGKDRLRQWLKNRYHGKVQLIGWHGLNIALSLDEPMQRKIYFTGEYNPNLTDVLIRLLKHASYVVDVGANVGIYTMLASAFIQQNGKVLAFEPSRREFEKLTQHVKINHLEDTIIPIHCGISNAEGELTLNVSDEQNKGINSFGVAPRGHQEVIKLHRLDNLLIKDNITKIDLLKIDTEGWEYWVLEGAGRFLEGAERPIIVYECDEHLLIGANSSSKMIHEFLSGKNYRLCEIRPGRKLVDVVFGTVFVHSDVIAIPAEVYSSVVHLITE